VKPLERLGQAWTPDERLTVCELFDAGRSLEEICRETGRPASTVVQALMGAKRLTQLQDGHYYAIPTMWCSWQTTRQVTDTLRKEAEESE